MIHSNCKLHSSVNDTVTFQKEAAKFAELGESIKETNDLMLRETKLLKELGVRSSYIFHFKRIQDIKDAIIAKHTFEQFNSSIDGNWNVDLVPKFVNSILKAFKITKQLYNRVEYKYKVAKYLPEDDFLQGIRYHAEQTQKITEKLRTAFLKVKTSFDEYEAQRFTAELLKGYHELLKSEISILQMGLYSTSSSAAAEKANQQEVQKEIDRRLAQANEVAAQAVSSLFLKTSIGNTASLGNGRFFGSATKRPITSRTAARSKLSSMSRHAINKPRFNIISFMHDIAVQLAAFANKIKQRRHQGESVQHKNKDEAESGGKHKNLHQNQGPSSSSSTSSSQRTTTRNNYGSQQKQHERSNTGQQHWAPSQQKQQHSTNNKGPSQFGNRFIPTPQFVAAPPAYRPPAPAAQVRNINPAPAPAPAPQPQRHSGGRKK